MSGGQLLALTLGRNGSNKPFLVSLLAWANCCLVQSISKTWLCPPHVFQEPSCIARAALRKHHKLRGLEQQRLIVSQSRGWKSEINVSVG